MKKDGREDKIAVVVGTITDDIRVHKLPKMKVSLSFFNLSLVFYTDLLFLHCMSVTM